MKSFLALFICLLLVAGCARPPAADLSVKVPQIASDEVVVYVRTGCPYCELTLDVIFEQGYVPESRNVTEDRQAYQELRAIYREYFSQEEIIVPVIGKNQRFVRGFNRQSIVELLRDAAVTDPDDYLFCD
ncbi:Glutaredoxin [Geoalkalibacter ferrihydriticus]|uniref:Glutaredoxin domain-containing protein n=2 Tax=Geoalkalibacter ferrihydriticus TaxID=392333 RepID=A0A0C2EAD9_9BACT|nr:glutaredoxin family protein [Geoalkalibacter ferrihydriticus]KIH75538.1 hypothetical protein GFER_16490 [Geoalkalibacter ferrihydriticus DSM 17813]SDM89631.1 Glutaredoxin [Geoalkalibacter ferrihydriticus]